ncbi:MAG: alanine--tRNA ligase, partial [Bacteroidota bacterium]
MSASLESTRSESVRQAFLDFFAEKQHEIVRSASLVPHDDPTLMFTNAGMNQFKDVFLATGSRPYLRAADTQKCLRVSGKHNDLEEVGVDTYHHTLFEMLGNWSFGDYFKREAIAWAWELLVDRWGLDPQRLYVTVHEGDEALGLEPDDEAANLWRTETTVPHDHILYADSKDNFWSMGDTGPCGPCSEIHVDLRSDEERAQVPGKQLVNADDPRVIEIWNLVFIQYNALGDGRLEPLAAQHVDTGMGFERIVAVLQGSSSTYDTDLFAPIFARLAELSPRGDVKGYDDLHINDEAERERVRIAMRVVADHIRAVSFAIADGAMPSNEGRGYVIRRILRRAVRYGYQSLGFTEPFLYELFEPLRDKMAGSFPELDEQAGLIVRVIKAEEEGFLRTLETGLKLFDEQVAQAGSDTLSGDAAFLLHDTYGFPVDLTELMAREQGLSVDKDRYDELMQEQKDRARAATAFKSGQNVAGEDTANQLSDTEFVGYEHVQDTGAKIIDARAIEPASEGEPFTYQLVLDRT